MIAAGRADAAVVGGGPAGAVTALLLARAGRDVVLYEQSHYDALRLDETLPPSVDPLLRRLGLWERFGALQAMPSYQAASAWEATEPPDRSFILSPYGHGWHLQLDKLVCAARVFAIGSEPPGDTYIEAAPDGWWYVSPLPDQRRIIALFTDAHEVVRARLATVDGWTEALARTDHVDDLACGVPCGKIRVTTSASHELEPAVGHDWIAVGDAAFAVDPLSSGGVAFALRSATAAADVLLGGDRLAYQKQIADEASEYRRLRAEIYGWEHRFADAAFWRARRLSVDQPLASRAATSRAVGIDGAAPSRSTEQDAAALA